MNKSTLALLVILLAVAALCVETFALGLQVALLPR
jgi:hypothetical protein